MAAKLLSPGCDPFLWTDSNWCSRFRHPGTGEVHRVFGSKQRCQASVSTANPGADVKTNDYFGRSSGDFPATKSPAVCRSLRYRNSRRREVDSKAASQSAIDSRFVRLAVNFS